MNSFILLGLSCAVGGYLIGVFIGVKRAIKAEERADRYLFAILDMDRWCGHPFPAARIIAKHLKAIGEGHQLNAGTPCGEEPCTVIGLREQLRRLGSDDLDAAALPVADEQEIISKCTMAMAIIRDITGTQQADDFESTVEAVQKLAARAALGQTAEGGKL